MTTTHSLKTLHNRTFDSIDLSAVEKQRTIMSGKQIISLQFGNYSNYVGTHIWNTQVFRRYQASLILKDTYFGRDEVCQELDYDVLSRSGRNLWVFFRVCVEDITSCFVGRRDIYAAIVGI